MMVFHILYWIILATLGLLNLWLVKQNYHRSFTFGASPFNSLLYDKYSFQLNTLNFLLWFAAIILGFYWEVYWWLASIIFFISYRDGRKRALGREYQVLKERELREGLKDINGNTRTAEEELLRLLEFRKKKLSGYYNR
jgi:hypothetical protein